MPNVKRIANDIRKDGHASIDAMMERKQEFSTPMAAMLAGIANDPGALREFNRRLDEEWSQAKIPASKQADEVVIGAGIHASIYCAMRVAMGFPKPLVLEGSNRVGGIMAVSEQPSFALNSRNRPGNWVGTPGMGALNVIPGAPIQPSDLSGAEYQRNSDLAFCVRSSLAMNANVVVGKKVVATYDDYSTTGSRIAIYDGDGKVVNTKRVILATGLGDPRGDNTGSRVMNFTDFMKRMDGPFPLKDMKRVAVIGAGDTGRVIVEALTGQGPIGGMSTVGLDWVEQIDWYGLREEGIYNREQWNECNRSRYAGISRLFPSQSDASGERKDGVRITPRERMEQVSNGYQIAYVNERPYDHVIYATGFEPDYISFDRTPEATYFINNRAIAKYSSAYGDRTDQRVYTIGPVSNIPLSEVEKRSMPPGIPENSAALFRYANRTAQLAATLGGEKAKKPAPRKKEIKSERFLRYEIAYR